MHISYLLCMVGLYFFFERIYLNVLCPIYMEMQNVIKSNTFSRIFTVRSGEQWKVWTRLLAESIRLRVEFIRRWNVWIRLIAEFILLWKVWIWIRAEFFRHWKVWIRLRAEFIRPWKGGPGSELNLFGFERSGFRSEHYLFWFDSAPS